MSDSFADPMDCSLPGFLSIGFPRQEYWSGLPFPSPEDLSDPGIKPTFPALSGILFIAEPQEKSFQKMLLGNLDSHL